MQGSGFRVQGAGPGGGQYRAPGGWGARLPELISHKVFSKPFCKSQPPHKSVNLFFPHTEIKNELTNLSGN